MKTEAEIFGVGSHVNHLKKISQPPLVHFFHRFLGALMEEKQLNFFSNFFLLEQKHLPNTD
ncbi:hypothetical protein NBRC111894_4369 [Sporolactobacillus inulinus]|uniref:Uncharacterized protein n=1 Tax=Sporolactobacillus inulinus TaxID=2078 RepID=A0A4Y1ZIA7_9BACL|nr:hypothetical protein NBRC111894_4369 [Sporolactobacillus inulinus]